MPIAGADFRRTKNSSTQSDDIKFTNSITKDSFEDEKNNSATSFN
jgi:hypothetical protein